MKSWKPWMFFWLGLICCAGAIPSGVRILDITLGPSVNARNMCKELQRQGYLADECFYADDGTLKSTSCKGKVKEQTQSASEDKGVK